MHGRQVGRAVKIVILVKAVPDTFGERKLSLDTGLADRAAIETVLDEIGARALEVGLSYADAHPDTEVVILMMAPEPASATLRKALSMGATAAVQIVDEALLGADLGLTAEALAAALTHIGFDLVIAGNQSTDGVGGVIPAMIAELLDVPNFTCLNSIELGAGSVAGERATDGGSLSITAPLPAIVSVTERFPEPRFPNFKNIMAAKKKSIETLSLSDLAVDANDLQKARSIVLGLSEKPARQAGEKVIDEGDGGRRIAEFLVLNRLA